ncbi:MAG: hypothetical protein ACPHRO_15850, partial [Nannocystaceae bacterium]
MNGRRLHRSFCAAACVVVCGVFAPHADAATARVSVANQDPTSDRARAQQLYQEGKVAFDLANFDEAIEKFEQAYALMSATDDPDAYKVLALIVRNLSLAHRRAFELNQQEINLQKALILLRRYKSQIANIEPTENFPQEEIDKGIDDSAKTIAELEQLIARALHQMLVRRL